MNGIVPDATAPLLDQLRALVRYLVEEPRETWDVEGVVARTVDLSRRVGELGGLLVQEPGPEEMEEADSLYVSGLTEHLAALQEIRWAAQSGDPDLAAEAGRRIEEGYRLLIDARDVAQGAQMDLSFRADL